MQIVKIIKKIHSKIKKGLGVIPEKTDPIENISIAQDSCDSVGYQWLLDIIDDLESFSPLNSIDNVNFNKYILQTCVRLEFLEGLEKLKQENVLADCALIHKIGVENIKHNVLTEIATHCIEEPFHIKQKLIMPIINKNTSLVESIESQTIFFNQNGFNMLDPTTYKIRLVEAFEILSILISNILDTLYKARRMMKCLYSLNPHTSIIASTHMATPTEPIVVRMTNMVSSWPVSRLSLQSLVELLSAIF